MKLHFDFYYSKEIEVTTTCWKEYVTYRIRELGDSPGMTEAEYDAQNQHTLRRVEKDGDGWAAMGRVVPRSPRVETVDQTPKRLETADKGNNHPKHEMVVVTGANSGYFHALENFIGSMHFWEPTRPIIVYNLGLSASQVDQVNTWHNVHLEWPRGIPKTYAPHVHALKKYAWKTNAIYESTNKYAATLWLDAGCEVRGPLTDIESILQKDGVFLVQGQDGDMTRWVHDGTLRYFNVERSALSKKPSFAGGIEGWIQNSKAYHKILEPLVECANKKECIDPTGASLGNHRYDQSALSVITYTSGMNIVPHTEFLAARSSQLHADIKKPNTMCIWTARGGSSAYKRYTKSVNKLNPPLTRIKQNTMSVNKLKKPLTSIKHKSQPYVVFSTTTGVTHARESDYDFAIVNISPKITIKNSIGFNRDEPCDIPCHYTTGSGPVDATVYELRGRRAPPSGISVYMQMEGEHYYPIDTTGWTVENTYRWSSPLLKPYFEWIHYHGKTDIQSKRVAPDAIDGISFLARNCGSRNHREQVVKDLIQQVRVDSMSSCLHNHDKPGTDDKIDIMKRYKFHAAFENGNVRDYVTEKVYLALAAGTVPIYLGAPNIDEFVPKGSIIRVDSFENTAALAQHVQECIANETLYQSYHEWRDRPLNSEFVERFAFTNVSTECRTCRWVYAHKHGLPWDKKSQTFELGAKENLGTIPYFKRFSNNSIFVKTGDIPDMWIRDSTAQVWPLRDDGPLVEKVLNMQSFFILQDPYANSYRDHEVQSPTREDLNLGREGWVATRNYELDSGCYFLRLLYHAWKHHDLAVQKYRQTVETLVNTWKTEQYHEEKSPYRYAELPRNGLGTPVKWTGMTWSGFRPSDDACTYGYHIPSNLFAAKALTYVSEMFPDIKEANVLRQDILTGVQQYGTWADTDGKTRYCYEVDGLGGCNKMDDANVPSLLSIPYLDPEGYDRALWENTYEWIWSSKNPYFYKGTAAEGIGSPHTPHNYIWPMSLVMRGLVDPAQCQVMKALVKKTMTRNTIHESFDKNNVQRLTREDFAWPNALYQEMDC